MSVEYPGREGVKFERYRISYRSRGKIAYNDKVSKLQWTVNYIQTPGYMWTVSVHDQENH